MAKHSTRRYFDEEGRLIIKPYYLRDLAAIYEVNYQTMRRWLDNFPQELGKKDGKRYSIFQVEFIVAQFGLPRRIGTITQAPEIKTAA